MVRARARVLTFAAVSGDLGEGVVAAVALASDHAGLALALAAVAVTRSGEGAERVAFAQQTAVAAPGAVVVVLDTNEEEGHDGTGCHGSSNESLFYIPAFRVASFSIGNRLRGAREVLLCCFASAVLTLHRHSPLVLLQSKSKPLSV